MHINLLWLLLIPVINYILYSISNYMDHRYNMGIGENHDDWPIALIFLFGFFYMIGVILILIFSTLCYIHDSISKVLNIHKELAEIGKLKRKQEKDLDYQVEKALLDKK